MIPTVLLFDEILESVFSDSVNGVYCVVENDQGDSLTYKIENGKPVLW